ncbi:titin homolog, partial [Lucilia sericata]|uniref:titin homolog n=1 Tax=Lucilia sericata TaxID=13632 RepID=UPI0018A7FBEA
NEKSKDLKEKDVFEETSSEKNSTPEKYTKQKRTVSSQIEKVNLQLPSNNKKNSEDNKTKNSKKVDEQQKTETKNTENLKSLPLNKKENDDKSKQDNNTLESNKLQKETIQDVSLSTNLPETSKLCTPRKVALFNELFGPSSSESSTTAASSCKGTNSLLTNIKGILAKTNQTDILSSATTSPGDYTDISSGMATPKEDAVEVISSENTTPTNIKDNNDGDLVKTNIDNCFILTQNVDKEVKTIACVDLTELLDDDIENEVDLIEIPGLDLCSGSKAKNSTKTKTDKKNLSKDLENSSNVENDENRKTSSGSEIPVSLDNTDLEKVSLINASDKQEIVDSSEITISSTEEIIELVEHVNDKYDEKVKSLQADRREGGSSPMSPSVDETAIKSADVKQMITAIESVDKLDDAAVVEKHSTESKLDDLEMESFDTKSNTEEIPLDENDKQSKALTSEEQMKITASVHSTTSTSKAPGSNIEIKETDLAFKTKIYKNSNKLEMTENDNSKAEQSQESVDASTLSDNMTEVLDHTSSANENSNSNLPENSLNSEEACSMETEIIIDETFDEIQTVEESDRELQQADTNMSPLIDKNDVDTTIDVNLNEAEVVESFPPENLINNSDSIKNRQNKEENELILALTEELPQTECELEEITEDLTANNNLKTDQTKTSNNINENIKETVSESKANESDENSTVTCADDMSEADLLEKSMENFTKTKSNEEVALISSALIENNNNECTIKVSDSHMEEEKSNSLAIRAELKTILDSQAEISSKHIDDIEIQAEDEQTCTKTSAEETENLITVRESRDSTVLEQNNETAESNDQMTLKISNDEMTFEIANEKGVNAEETAASIVLLESNKTIVSCETESEVQKISLETSAIDSENDSPTLKPSDSTALEANKDQCVAENKRLEETTRNSYSQESKASCEKEESETEFEASKTSLEISGNENLTSKSYDSIAPEAYTDLVLAKKKPLEVITQKDGSETESKVPKTCDSTILEANKDQTLVEKKRLEETTDSQETTANSEKDKSVIYVPTPNLESAPKVLESCNTTAPAINKVRDVTQKNPLEETTANNEVSELRETVASCEKEESRSNSQVEISAKVAENEIQTTKSSDFNAPQANKKQSLAENVRLEEDNDMSKTETHTEETIEDVAENASDESKEKSYSNSLRPESTTEKSIEKATDSEEEEVNCSKTELTKTSTQDSINKIQIDILETEETSFETPIISSTITEKINKETDEEMKEVPQNAIPESEAHHEKTLQESATPATDSNSKQTQQVIEVASILEYSKVSDNTQDSSLNEEAAMQNVKECGNRDPKDQILTDTAEVTKTSSETDPQTSVTTPDSAGWLGNSNVRESYEQITQIIKSSETDAQKSVTTSDSVARESNVSNAAEKMKNFRNKNHVTVKPIQALITGTLKKQLQEFFLRRDKHLTESKTKQSFKSKETALVLANEKLKSTKYFKSKDDLNNTQNYSLKDPLEKAAKDVKASHDIVKEQSAKDFEIKENAQSPATPQQNEVLEFQAKSTDSGLMGSTEKIIKDIEMRNIDLDESVNIIELNETEKEHTANRTAQANPTQTISGHKSTEHPIEEISKDLKTPERPLTKKVKVEKKVPQQQQATSIDTSIGLAASPKQNAKNSLDLETSKIEQVQKAICEKIVPQEVKNNYVEEKPITSSTSPLKTSAATAISSKESETIYTSKELYEAVDMIELSETEKERTANRTAQAIPLQNMAKDKPTKDQIEELNEDLQTPGRPLTKKAKVEKKVPQQMDTFIKLNLEATNIETKKQNTSDNKKKVPVESVEHIKLIPEISEVSKQQNADIEASYQQDTTICEIKEKISVRSVKELTQSADLITNKLIHEILEVPKQQNADLEATTKQHTTTCQVKEKTSVKSVEDLTQSAASITNKLHPEISDISKEQQADLETTNKQPINSGESVEYLTQPAVPTTIKLIPDIPGVSKQQNIETSKLQQTTTCVNKEKISVKSIEDLTQSADLTTDNLIQVPKQQNTNLETSKQQHTTTCVNKEKISVKSIEDLTQSAVPIRNKLTSEIPKNSKQQSANRNTETLVNSINPNKHENLSETKKTNEKHSNLPAKHAVPVGSKISAVIDAISHRMQKTLGDIEKTITGYESNLNKDPIPSTSAPREQSLMKQQVEAAEGFGSFVQKQLANEVAANVSSVLTNSPEGLVCNNSKHNINKVPIPLTSAPTVQSIMKQPLQKVEGIGSFIQRQLANEEVANVSSPEALVGNNTKFLNNNSILSGEMRCKEQPKTSKDSTQKSLQSPENTDNKDAGETECFIPKLSYFATSNIATPSNVFQKIITKEINIEGEIVEVVRIHIPKGSNATNEIRKFKQLTAEILSSPASCSNKNQEIERMVKKSNPIGFECQQNKILESTAINSCEILNSPATYSGNHQEIERNVKKSNPTVFDSPQIPILDSIANKSCEILNSPSTFSSNHQEIERMIKKTNPIAFESPQIIILDSTANKSCEILNPSATSSSNHQEIAKIVKKTNPTSFESPQITILDSTANKSCEILNPSATSSSNNQEIAKIVKKTNPTSFESPQIPILDSTTNKSCENLNPSATSSSNHQEIERIVKKTTTTSFESPQIPILDSTTNKSCEILNTPATSSNKNQDIEKTVRKSTPTNTEFQQIKILDTTANKSCEKSPLKECKTPRKETTITALNKEVGYLTPKTLAYKHSQEKDSYITISSILPETFSTTPVLPSISTTSPTPSNFSGLFSKKTSNNLNTEDELIRTKKKSPLFINKPKEYIIPAASVLCNVDNLENATKANKKLHWELLENKNEMTEIEDDADVDTTDEEEPKIKEEPLEQASTSPKQTSPQSKTSDQKLQKTSTSETDTQTEDESLLKELKRQDTHKKLKRKSSKVHKSKHHKHKLPKTVKARLKAIAKRNEKDTLTDSGPMVQPPFTIILPKRPVGRPRKLQNCPKVEKVVVQHKKRGRKPKQIVLKPNDVATPKESLESSYKTKSNESFKEKKRNAKERYSPDVVNNLENTLRILSSSVERLEICDETCNSRDSSKQRKTFEKQMEESQYEDAFNTSMIYHKQDSSRESINISAVENPITESQKMLQKQNKPESTKPFETAKVSSYKTDLLSASIIKEPVIKLIELPSTSREAQSKLLIISSERKPGKVKSNELSCRTKKEKSLKSKSKILMKKKLKSKMKNKVAPFISLEDIGIKVRPLKGHLSSFKIPKIKKDTEESIDDSWKLEAYEELEKKDDKEDEREAVEHEKERRDNEREEKDKQLSPRPKASKEKETTNVKETNQKSEKLDNMKPLQKESNLETIQAPHNKPESKDGSNTPGNYIIQFDNKTKTGKRKLFSPDMYDESEKAENFEISENKNSQQIYEEQCQYLSETHELNPVKFTQKSLIYSKKASDISLVANSDGGETSSNNTSTKPRRKSINIHRRILDSSSEEDEVNAGRTNEVKELSEEVTKTTKTSKTEAGKERNLEEATEAISALTKETKKPLRGRRKSMYVESTAKETVVSEESETKKESKVTRRKSMYIERTSPEAVQSEDSETIKPKKQPARRKSMYFESAPIEAVETEEETIKPSKTSRRKSMYVESSGKEAVESEESETSKRIKPIRIKSMYVEGTPLEPVETEEETIKASKTNRRKSMYVESTAKEVVEPEESVPTKRNIPSRRKSMYVERTPLEAIETDEETTKHNKTNPGKSIPVESTSQEAVEPEKSVTTKRNIPVRRKSMYVERTSLEKIETDEETTKRAKTNKEESLNVGSTHLESKNVKADKPIKALRRKSVYFESPASLESETEGIEANKPIKACAETKNVQEPQTARDSSKLTEKCNEQLGNEPHPKEIKANKPIKAIRRKSMYIESPASLESETEGIEAKKPLKAGAETAPNHSKLTEKCNEEHGKELHPNEVKADRSIKAIRRKSMYIESPAVLESEIEANKSVKAGIETELVQEPQTALDSSKLTENCNEQCDKEPQPKSDKPIKAIRRKSMYIESPASLKSDSEVIEVNKPIKIGSETKLVQEPQTELDKSKLTENCNDQQDKELQPTKAIQSFKMRRKTLNISKPQTENIIETSSSSLNPSKIEEFKMDSKTNDISKSLCEHPKESTKPITSFKMRRKSLYLERNSLKNEDIEKDSRDLKKVEPVKETKVEERNLKNKEESNLDSNNAIGTRNSKIDSLRKQIVTDSDSLMVQQKSNKIPCKSTNQQHNLETNNEEHTSEDELEQESESKRLKLDMGSDTLPPDAMAQKKSIKMRRQSTTQRHNLDSLIPDRACKKDLEVSKKSKQDKEKKSEDKRTPQTDTVSVTIKARRKSTNQTRDSGSSIEQEARKDSTKTKVIKPEETKNSQQMDSEAKSLDVSKPAKPIKMRRKSTIERVNLEATESTKSTTSKQVLEKKCEEKLPQIENSKQTETLSSSSMKMRRKSTNQPPTEESCSKDIDHNKDVDTDSSLVLTPHKSIKIRRKSINHLRILDSSSSDDNEPLIKKPTVIATELKTPLTTAPKSRSRKKRVVKVLSSSMESPVTNTTNSSHQSSDHTSPLASPNHPIFDTEVPTQSTEFAASMPMTPNQQDDNKFKEIDSKLHEIFQSPQYTVDYRISAAVDSSNVAILPPPAFKSDINETPPDFNSAINQSSVNISQINDSNSTLNDTTATQSGSEVKHLSLGAADYRFEKVSDNVINLFISRKRKRKRNN